jgi:hypothetical protein
VGKILAQMKRKTSRILFNYVFKNNKVYEKIKDLKVDSNNFSLVTILFTVPSTNAVLGTGKVL